MKEDSRKALQRYLKSSESWATDRNEMLARSKTTAWRVTAVVSAIALMEGFALLTLVPLKTVQPYTLLVDRHTGYVEALKPLEQNKLAADTALTRSFLVQYVIAREGFVIETVQADYRKAVLWSAGEARQQYMAGMQPTNPESPLALYSRSTIINVVVKSVTSLSPDSVMIRFDTQRVDRGSPSAPQVWVAVLRFTYSGEPMTTADRLVNPLGFRVLRYRRSQEQLDETLPPPPPPFPTSPQSLTTGESVPQVSTPSAPRRAQVAPEIRR